MNKTLYLTLCLALNAFLIFCVAASTTNTSIGKKSILNSEIKMLVPEGWGFFTKNPQEDIVDIYLVDNKNLHRVVYQSGSYHNVFGLSRKYRRLEAEREILQSQITKDKWTYTKPVSASDIRQHTTIVSATAAVRNLRGTYLLCKTKRIPWAWASLKANCHTLTQYTYVTVKG
ncbi:SdpA family antimicrobial peptide system protein [Hymenobacter chitinivorans]|uniref:Antimicrobial peptide system SdpA family protein n=1 Tax=Hymenobacter chitinivorans DSM 11115 TaxID=1121954 RepID=A0A2M9AQS5_9BACT|nr:SdpA family antimicrobial peptide system protein [Hymenobacter chitinivorans]PJJ48051.1 antimicrobial peptide system SdpA family protein [Hymenobacter chitinivorans DSM 11115]